MLSSGRSHLRCMWCLALMRQYCHLVAQKSTLVHFPKRQHLLWAKFFSQLPVENDMKTTVPLIRDCACFVNVLSVLVALVDICGACHSEVDGRPDVSTPAVICRGRWNSWPPLGMWNKSLKSEHAVALPGFMKGLCHQLYWNKSQSASFKSTENAVRISSTSSSFGTFQLVDFVSDGFWPWCDYCSTEKVPATWACAHSALGHQCVPCPVRGQSTQRA